MTQICFSLPSSPSGKRDIHGCIPSQKTNVLPLSYEALFIIRILPTQIPASCPADQTSGPCSSPPSLVLEDRRKKRRSTELDFDEEITMAHIGPSHETASHPSLTPPCPAYLSGATHLAVECSVDLLQLYSTLADRLRELSSHLPHRGSSSHSSSPI
jgi:hypothetical protein